MKKPEFWLGKVIGLKVIAIKGFIHDKRKTQYIEPQYILFDDGKTYIELKEQDYYSYHDCSTSARHLDIREDERVWNIIMKNEDGNSPDANYDI